MNLENLKKIAAVVFLIELISRSYFLFQLWSIMNMASNSGGLLFGSLFYTAITITGFIGVISYLASKGKKVTLFKANMGYYLVLIPNLIYLSYVAYSTLNNSMLSILLSEKLGLWISFLVVTTLLSAVLSFIILYKLNLEYRNRNFIVKDEEGNLVNTHTITSNGNRVLNYIIDFFGCLFFYSGFYSLLRFMYEDDGVVYRKIPIIVIYIFLVIASIIYYTFFEVLFGQTWGKMFTNTIVGNEYAERPSAGQIIVRSFARHIPFNVLSFLFNRDWHDNISKTYVYDIVHPDDEVVNIEFDAEKENED